MNAGVASEAPRSTSTPPKETLSFAKFEFASGVANVAVPATSKFPLASIAPVNVETPDTLSCVASANPNVLIPVTLIAAKVAPDPPPRT